MNKMKMFKVFPVFCTIVLAGGCTVTTQPLSLDELQTTKDLRQQSLMMDQEPISGPISLHDAMARAIKYNLDYKVEVFEEALRLSESKLSSLEQLPKLVASAGLSGRDNYSASRSSPLFNENTIGDPSTTPSTSSEKDVTDASLRLSWDILDFGLSYVRAKQSADRVLIANERKRIVINRVIANVRTAYWRAVSAERLATKLKIFEADVSQALDSAEKAYEDRKASPLPALTYQRELLQIQENIQSLEGEMRLAKMQLAALINIDPSTPYTIVIPKQYENLDSISWAAEKLIDAALLDRPELRELSYEQRINQKQAQVALLEVLPNLSFFGGFNYDNNEYLYNNQWVNWGAQTSWNIVDAFKYPYKARTVEVNGEFLDQRALALTMAVITQVHVGLSRFEVARKKLGTVEKLHTVNNNILDQIVGGYKSRKVSYQTYVRENMNSIVAQARYDIAYAELQNAYADIYTSVGQHVFGDVDASTMSVDELSEHLESYWRNLPLSGSTKVAGL